jgi:RNA polymerase sigma-70 factor (ECF subfamily)
MKTARFPNTRWSLLNRAAAPDQETRGSAIADVLAAYRPGLRRYLIEGRRLSADAADDLLQEFIAEKVLALNFLSSADQSRGRFRSFLLASLNNFIATRLRRQRISMARTIALDDAGDIAADPDDALQCFEREWVKQVVRLALELMENECVEQRRPDLWDMFRLRVAEPILRGVEPTDYPMLVTRLGLSSPRQAINLLASAKRVFARHLRAAIGYYVPADQDIDQEITDLREICLR